MKIQLLVAIGDNDYMEHLSQVLSDSYADVFEVSVLSTLDRLESMPVHRQFDVALFDAELAEAASFNTIRMPMVLCDEMSSIGAKGGEMKKIRKYQRISNIVSDVLAGYAEVSDNRNSFDEVSAHITAVWSPSGGCGKTTAALAYGAQKVAEGRKTVYLDLEPFSSVETYFSGKGKSISTVLDKLENNADLLLQSIRMEDKGSGIYYFSKPENYDDINILTKEDVALLIKNCARGMDELVIDLAGACDEKVRCALEMADEVLLVVDASQSSQIKWNQFRTQHDLYGKICSKLTLVANRNAKVDGTHAARVVLLPLVQSDDPVVIYKTLSVGYFAK